MSDTDRLTDYLRRMSGDDSPRVLEDGCTAAGCGLSQVSCHVETYMRGSEARCCTSCSH